MALRMRFMFDVPTWPLCDTYGVCSHGADLSPIGDLVQDLIDDIRRLAATGAVVAVPAAVATAVAAAVAAATGRTTTTSPT